MPGLFKKKSNQKVLEELLMYFILFVITILFLLVSPNSPFGNGNSLTDSSVFRYIGLLMSNHNVPYLNVFDHKGPLLYFINYIGIIININNGIWYMEIASLYISMIFAYKLGMFLTNKLNAFLATITSFIPLIYMFEFGNLTEEFALPFIFISMYLFVKDYTKYKYVNNITAFIIGLCCGATILLRPNLIIFWLCLSLFLLFHYLKQRKYSSLLIIILFFILGNIVFILPFISYLCLKGAFYSFVQDYIIFNFAYSSSTSAHSIWDIVNVFIKQSKYILFVLVILFYFSFNKNKKELSRFSIIYLLMTFLIVVLPKRDYAHYGMILVPTFLIAFIYMWDLLSNVVENNIKKVSGQKTILIILFLSIFYGDLKILSNQINLQLKAEDCYINITSIIKKYTKEDDNLLVFGNDVILYLKSNRFTSSKYPYQIPIIDVSESIREDFINEVSNKPPDLIVVRKEYDELLNSTIGFINDKYSLIDNEDIIFNLYLKK